MPFTHKMKSDAYHVCSEFVNAYDLMPGASYLMAQCVGVDTIEMARYYINAFRAQCVIKVDIGIYEMNYRHGLPILN